MISVLVSPAESDRELAATLEQSGAGVSIWPAVNIGPPADDSSLDEAIENLFGYDWLVLKNVRAAEYFLRAFFLTHQAEELDDLRVLIIGSETGEKLAEHQVHVDIMLDQFRQTEVYREIESYVGDNASLARQNLLTPSASIIIEAYEVLFLNAGARVDQVTAYKTSSDKRELIRLKSLLAGGGIDFIVFTGAPAVAEFAILFDTDDLGRVLTGVKVACLDRITSDVAGNYGLSETMIPSERSIRGLAEIVVASGHC